MFESKINKGQPNGYASLNDTGKISIGQIRDILTLPSPNQNDVVSVVVNSMETIIKFNNGVGNDFTFDIKANPSTIVGDRIYIIISPLSGVSFTSSTITFTGQMNPILCGDQNYTWNTNNYTNVLEFIFDGTNFTGIDNC